MQAEVVLTTFSLSALAVLVAFIAIRLWRARKRGVSIRMQIFLALAGIVGAFALGLGLLVLERVMARTNALAEESAKSEALAIVALLETDMARTGRPLDEIAKNMASLPSNVRMTLLDGDEKVLFAAADDLPESETVSVTLPIVVHGELRGFVRVDKPTIVIRRVLQDFAPTILAISVTLGAAAAVASALIGRSIAAPIEELTAFAVRVSHGKLLGRAPRGFGREVRELSRALETMRRELEGRPFVETFAADLSHELKNPVAAIRASAEVLSDGALDEPVEARRFVGRIQEATTRIEILLGELLSLARIEARGIESASTVGLEGLFETIAARATERGARVTFRGGNAEVRGDALWLARLLSNLVDNAIHHGPPAGTVRVAAETNGAEVVVWVENDGEIAGHIRKKLFRRFVTTRSGKGGTGLGLAIARAVATAHGGSIECSASGPPTVRFTVYLPTALRGPMRLIDTDERP